MLWHEDIPVVRKDGISIHVIAGHLDGATAVPPAPDSWAFNAEHQVAIWNIHMEVGSELALPPASDTVNRSLYFYEGDQITVDGLSISSETGLHLDASAITTISNGRKEAHLLMLQGRPILEPVAKYGPFVMNSQYEIEQAIEDYRLTRFGGWPWPHPDNVHPREKGRFAKYPDGKIEER